MLERIISIHDQSWFVLAGHCLGSDDRWVATVRGFATTSLFLLFTDETCETFCIRDFLKGWHFYKLIYNFRIIIQTYLRLKNKPLITVLILAYWIMNTEALLNIKGIIKREEVHFYLRIPNS